MTVASSNTAWSPVITIHWFRSFWDTVINCSISSFTVAGSESDFGLGGAQATLLAYCLLNRLAKNSKNTGKRLEISSAIRGSCSLAGNMRPSSQTRWIFSALMPHSVDKFSTEGTWASDRALCLSLDKRLHTVCVFWNGFLIFFYLQSSMIIAVVAWKLPPSNDFLLQSKLSIAKICSFSASEDISSGTKALSSSICWIIVAVTCHSLNPIKGDCSVL